MIRYLFIGCILILINNSYGQHFAKYLNISKTSAYYHEVKANPNKKLVEIKKFIPGIVLDIRYATTNNFTHH